MKLLRLVFVVLILPALLFADDSQTDAPLRPNGRLHCVSPLTCTTLGGVTTIDGSAIGGQATGTGFMHFIAGVADAAAKTVDLTSGDVTGILTTAKGGNGNGFFAVAGPAASAKTFTFPNASANVLTDNAAVTVAQGGTGIASGTSGGIPYYSSTSAITSSALLTANALVLGGGAGTTPATNTAFTTNGTTELDIGIAGGGNGVLGLNGNTSGTAKLTAPAVAGTITNPIVVSNNVNILGPTTTLSLAGNGNAVLALSGNTSGTATFTAPAVAGTSTNGVTSSNVLLAPDGTAAAPSYSFSSDAAFGWYRASSGLMGFATGGTLKHRIAANWYEFGSGAAGLLWAPDNSFGSFDTSLCRNSAGVISIGNTSTCSSTAGYIKTGQTLQVITSNFTTASASLVTITGLTWTAPVSNASNWSFECNLLYSQATGAAANLWGVQTATTAATNLAAGGDIFTSNAGAHTQGAVTAISSTTAQTVVTATPAATATIYQGRMWGTIEAPSNASPTVLNIQVATGNVSDTITVYRGSQCQVW